MKQKNNNNINDDAVVNINIGIFGIIIIIVAALIIAGIISLVIGFLGFVGLCFLIAGAYLFLIKKGDVTITKSSPFIFCILLGLVLIVLSSVGLEIMQLDLSGIPGLQQLHMMINP